MSSERSAAGHPNLERYYDRATDRALVDAHLAGCPECRAWLEDIHERLGRLACNELVEFVTEHLDGAADEPRRARIDDHLRLCEGCRDYLDEMRATIATIGRTDRSPEPSEPIQDGLLATFRAWRRFGPDRDTED